VPAEILEATLRLANWKQRPILLSSSLIGCSFQELLLFQLDHEVLGSLGTCAFAGEVKETLGGG